MNAMSKSSAELNEPIASFEFNLANSSTVCADGQDSMARFDMNRGELSQLLESFNAIQSAYESIVSTAK